MVRNADGTVFALNTAGALSSIPGSGSSTQFPGTYWSIALGPDDALYALQASGNLGDVAVNSANVELVASGVLAIVADTTGDLYKLYTTGALSVMCAGSTTWTPLLTNVKSVTPSGGGASVLTNAGVDWQYLGTAGTLVAGPHLSLTMGGAATAGQSVSATLAVLDLNNNPVLGYTGTVTLSDSDGAAAAAGDGPPLTHTFSAADNGTFSFPVIFLTSGSQTLSVAGNGGLTASASVTVSAGAATQFSVDPPPVPVGTLIPVTAATWASDVVTIATPPLAGGFSVGDSLTISGMTPAGYNGTITIASVLSDTQFTYLLTTDPGTATGFGGVVPHATVTVTAYDANGNVATGYTGSVTLAPVDNSATSPITYTFTTADQGTHQFSETFSQPGGQKLVATGGSLAGDGAIVVTPASYDLSQSIVSLSPEGVAADGQVVVTLTARDALGNQETGGGLQAAFGLAAGSVGGGSFSGATDNGDGTYTAIFTAGPFAGLDNITATIGGVPVTSSPASLVVTPAITSVNHATFVVGTDGSFTVTQTGTATPVYSESGKFPSGVTFDTSTGILSGTPAAGSGGVYNIVIGAASGSGPAGTQNFTLVVDQAPAIDSASQSLFVAGEPASFTVRATGFPGPTISETGTLPTGVAFAAGVLGGTPAAGSEGTYPLTFTAHNAAGADATQSFVLTVATALAATEGAPFSGQLATFSGANPNAQLSDYTVSVNWGDTTSATLGAGATLSGTAANGFTVTGSHTYAEESSNVPVQVVITDTGGASPVTANDTINIADAPLTATAGSAVSATEGATFLNVAVATFADANPAGVAGDYTATIDWGDKTALTTVTGSAFTSTGGVFSVPSSHAYAEDGSYTLTVIISDVGGSTTTVKPVATVVDAALGATAVPVTATEGTTFSGIVATFTDANPAGPTGDYTATIDWGDKSALTTVSGSAFTSAGGVFSVPSTHLYSEDGSYTLTVTISDVGGASATVKPIATVGDAALSATAVPVVATEGTTFNGTVATFADANPAGATGDYTATIDWGDGSPLTTVSGSAFTSAGGVFSVPSSHLYSEDGSYTLTVTISDVGGSTTTVKPVATVADAALSATAVPVVATEGATFSGTVVTFTDANPAGPTGDYTATIDWGDKTALTTVTGSAFTSAGGVFSVPSSHLYSEDGSYTLTVTISDMGGSTTTVNPVATVGDASLSATAVPVVATEGTTFSGTVATFTDANPAGATGDYTATIDWGDKTPLTTVTGSAFTSAGGVFSVPSSHLYSEDGNYTLTVTISDVGGSSTTAKPIATVGDASLSATAVPVAATEGATFSGNVATFTDANPAGPTGDYTATIDWGDKSALTTVSGSAFTSAGGVFSVPSTHLYSEDGSYTLTVTISDVGGSSTTVNPVATVGDAALSATAVPVVATEGATFSGTVVTFTDANPAGPTGDYTATIDWGDKTALTTVTGSAFTSAGGVFSVPSTHLYSEDGSYTLTVTISDVGGASATVKPIATVGDAALGATAVPVVATEGTTFNGTVATFADANPAGPTGDYTATIDWGDGSPLTTVSGSAFTSAAGGVFSVPSSHVYSAGGTASVTVTIDDIGGSSVTVGSQAAITPLPSQGAGATLYQATGAALSDVAVATFAHGDGSTPVDAFVATIDWGDGGTSSGTVSQSQGAYSVAGTHTYAQAGDFTVRTTVSEGGLASVIVSHALIGTPHQQYVMSVYEDVLGRAPDPGGLAYWSNLLDQGSAISSVAQSIAHSDEYYANFVIEPAYLKLLGRAADASGVKYWTGQMDGGVTDQQLEADLVSSPEFYTNAGGTNTAWIDAVYKLLLGRAADAAGENYWNSQLGAGETLNQVAQGIAGSQENNTQLINDDYFHYLGRAADSGGLDFWLRQFAGGTTNEDVIAGFTGAAEYYKEHTS